MLTQTGPGTCRESLKGDQSLRRFTNYVAVGLCILFFVSAGSAQQAPAAHPEAPFQQYFKKYPGLQEELGQLQTKLHEVQFPKQRSQSRLLPLLPGSTTFYMAFPNYGDALKQTLTIFRHEREQSAPLRDWWEHGEMAANGPKYEDYLEKASRLAEYLGDEIVISGAIEKGRKDPSLLILAEVQKPGLKDVLQQFVKELAGKSSPTVRVLDAQELAVARDSGTGDFVFLVRPDFLVGSLNVATLR